MPDEVRSLIITMLVVGHYQTDAEIAEVLGVSKASVSKIKKTIPPELLEGITQKRQAEIGMLVSQVLEESLIAAERIVRITSNEKWLAAQSASDLATFFGVISDKTFRILQAIEAANEAQREDTDGEILELTG